VELSDFKPFSPDALSAVFAACNRLKADGLIKDYALGGGLGALYYIEPFLTYDAYIFYEPASRGLEAGIPAIFEHLKKLGHSRVNERIAIEGLPTQFLAVHGLTADALKEAIPIVLDGVPGKVFQPEYLTAIAMQVNRSKDSAKAEMLTQQADLDETKLQQILQRHGIKRTI
jgi:hypothetical protein